MSSARKVSYYGIFASLAILMGYVERLVPLNIAVPGIKLGLANVVVLIVLYFMGTKSAFFISLIRILISALLFSGFAGFLYSAAGALLSFLFMSLGRKCKGLSIIGVSIIGGIFHNIGQILVACLVINTYKLIYYLPVLLIAGIGTGISTGLVAKYSLAYLERARNF